jgi:hypothetical protein
MVTYYSPVATSSSEGEQGQSAKSKCSTTTWVECGRVLVPELVKGQLEGGIAMGIGHALMEEMPLYEGGPGRATGTSTVTACRWPPRGGVEADCGNPAAAVAERPVQGPPW